jgi:hypothetical protein
MQASPEGSAAHWGVPTASVKSAAETILIFPVPLVARENKFHDANSVATKQLRTLLKFVVETGNSAFRSRLLSEFRMMFYAKTTLKNQTKDFKWRAGAKGREPGENRGD